MRRFLVRALPVLVAGGVAAVLAPDVAEAAPTTGTLRGTVTYAGHAAVGTTVFVFNAGLDRTLPLGTTKVAANGSYSVGGLTPGGGYTVCFDAQSFTNRPARGVLSECTSNRLWISTGLGFPDPIAPVRVSAGTTTTLTTRLATAGAISGRITGSGKAAPRASVVALDTKGRVVSHATADASGRYTITSLPPSTTGFAVCATGASTGYRACAPKTQFTGARPPAGVTRYKVTAGRTTTEANVDIDVTAPRFATVVGTVKGSGAPLPKVDVFAYYPNGGQAADVLTGTDGTYRITKLDPSAGPYAICFNPFDSPDTPDGSTYQPVCNKDVPWDVEQVPAGATKLALTAGQTATVDAALPTSAPAGGGTVSGVVSDAADGTKFSLAEVTVFSAPDADGLSRPVGGFRRSTAGGGYRITGVTPGTGYRVCVDTRIDTATRDGASPTGYASQCLGGAAWTSVATWDRKGPVRLPASATPVTVTADGTTTADIALQHGAAISGTLRGDGEPLSAQVFAVAAGSTDASNVSSDFADADGKFLIKNLTPTTDGFVICTDVRYASGGGKPSDADYGSRCYRTAAWAGGNAPLPADATPIPVTAGKTATADLDVVSQRTPSGTITGRVTSATNGGVVSGVTVVLPGGGASARTRYDGTFTMLRVPTGSQQVCFRPAVDIEDAAVPQQPFGDVCRSTPVVVTDGQTTSGVDAALPTR